MNLPIYSENDIKSAASFNWWIGCGAGVVGMHIFYAVMFWVLNYY